MIAPILFFSFVVIVIAFLIPFIRRENREQKRLDNLLKELKITTKRMEEITAMKRALLNRYEQEDKN